MAHARAHAQARDRVHEELELAPRHRLVGLGLREMRPRARQPRASRFVDVLGERRRVFRGAPEASHAGVDLQVDWHRPFRRGQCFSQLSVRHRDAAAGRRGGPGLRGHEPTHDQDLFRVDQPADLRRLLQGGDGEPGRAPLQGGVRDRHRAVAVAAGFDDREEPGALGQMAEDAGAVGADRAEVDVGPPQRGFQSPAWRRTFMTSGISSSRSLASRPESPRRSEMRRPAAAWT